MIVGFCVVERFDSTLGERWSQYVESSKLDHVSEIIGLDCMLCPLAVVAATEDHWTHAVYSREMFGVSDDPEFALSRVPPGCDPARLQVLAIVLEPTRSDVEAVRVPGFEFKGFDLIDEHGSISAITNWEHANKAFARPDLSACGLIESAARAYEVREALRRHYPNQAHAYCNVWAIWRREERSISR